MIKILFLIMILVLFILFISINILINELNSLQRKLKWTNLEVFETASNADIRMINFWDGLDLVDSFYIDKNGKPIKKKT